MQNVVQGCDIVFASERVFSCGDLIQDDTHGKHVGSAIHVLSKGLFWGHIGRFAFDLACGGFAGRASRGFGNTEVHEFHHAVVRDHDVLGGDVPMDQA
ncbi:MAG: hypothetical protein BWY17_03722 [Deltaproteobacteria bacterium ADurb.Bin207]|nr:MAG: hypothetical protein BWY17_03722 [Deltaproteobacteria bacterium ADurb.Bin207]